MIGLTLKQLRYFDALARHLHFGRAADACSISQPALSLQIKELEAMFDAHLVERGAREVRLTPIGEALLEKARGILLAVEEAARRQQSFQHTVKVKITTIHFLP